MQTVAISVSLCTRLLNHKSTAAPIAVNVRGLKPIKSTQSYWGFTINSSFRGGTFIGSSIVFCTGKCIFGTLEATTLRIGTGSSLLRLAFQTIKRSQDATRIVPLMFMPRGQRQSLSLRHTGYSAV